jgi:glycosyltransferase involved in cell wall biosynthesis
MPPVAEWTDPYGVPVRIIGTRPGRWGDYAYALGAAWTLYTDRRKYDVVYFLMTGLQLATGLPMARLMRKPIVVKFSGSNEVRKVPKSLLGRIEIRFIEWWASRIMVLNDGMVQETREVGLDQSKVIWMPNPVDVAEFRPASAEQRRKLRERLRVAQTTKVTLYVGRLSPEKELTSLIGGFARVCAEQPDAQLVLVGDGAEGLKLRALAETLGIEDRVRFTGRLPMDDVLAWMQAADTFALVSSLEGFPCSLEEAMSVGLASVVSDIPANRQLVKDGVAGLAIPVRDEEAIAAAIRNLSTDADGRARMGQAARAEVEAHYSTEKVTEMYEKVFHDILPTDSSEYRSSKQASGHGGGR